MLGAYGWAFVKPHPQALLQPDDHPDSVVVALLVGGLEVLKLVGKQLGPTRRSWRLVER